MCVPHFDYIRKTDSHVHVYIRPLLVYMYEVACMHVQACVILCTCTCMKCACVFINIFVFFTE